MSQTFGAPFGSEILLPRKGMAGNHPRVRNVRSQDARRILGDMQDWSPTTGWGPSYTVIQALGSLHAVLHEGEPFPLIISSGQSNDAEGSAPGIPFSPLTTPLWPYLNHTLAGTFGAVQGDEDCLVDDGRPIVPVASVTRTAGSGVITVTTAAAHGFTVGGGQNVTLFRTIGVPGLANDWYPVLSVPTATTFTSREGTQEAPVTTALSSGATGSVTRNRPLTMTDGDTRFLEPAADDPADAPRVITTRVPAIIGTLAQLGRPPAAYLHWAAGEGAEVIESFLPATNSRANQKPDPRQGGSPYNFDNLVGGVRFIVGAALRLFGRNVTAKVRYHTQGEGGALGPNESIHQTILDEMDAAVAAAVHDITGQLLRGEPPMKTLIVQTSNARTRTSARDIQFPYMAHLDLPNLFPSRFTCAGTMTRGRLQSSSDAHPVLNERLVLAGAHVQAYIDDVELGIGWRGLQIGGVTARPGNVYRLAYLKPPRLVAAPLELRLPAIPAVVPNSVGQGGPWRTAPFTASPLPNHGFSLIGSEAPDVRLTGVALVAGGNEIDITLSGPINAADNELTYADLPREWIGKIASVTTNVVPRSAISTIVRAANGATATVTTAAAHGLATGQIVRLVVPNNTEFTVPARVTVTSTTAFTVPIAGATAVNLSVADMEVLAATVFEVSVTAALAAGSLAVGDTINMDRTSSAGINELGGEVVEINAGRTAIAVVAASVVAGTPSGTGGVLYALRFTPWLPSGTGSVCIRDTRTNWWNTIFPADVPPEIDHGALRQRVRIAPFVSPFGALAGLPSLTWMVGASPSAQITTATAAPFTTVTALRNQKTGAAATDLFVQATAARQPGFISTSAAGGIAAATAADEAVIQPFYDSTNDATANPTARWMTGLTTGVLSSGAWTMMITARPSAATSGWLFSEATNASGDDNIGGRFLQSGNIFQVRSRTFSVSTAGVTIGQWYCLIFERTAAGLIRIRVNGVNSTAVDASSLAVTAQPFTLFALGPVQSLPFVGEVRRVAFAAGVAGITNTAGGEVAAFEAEAKAAHPTVFTF